MLRRSLLCRQIIRNSQRSFCSADVSDKPRFLPRPNGVQIAYRGQTGSNLDLPGVIFFPGFQSNMLGVKASALAEYCKNHDVSYIRFDYRGCGASSGDIRQVTYSDWKNDALAILDNLTAGPQILVGSSMGALIALDLAMKRAHRVLALIGIATVTQVAFQNYFPGDVLEQVERDGEAVFKGEHHNYILTRAFVEDARQHSLQDQLPIQCPVRLLHGMKDKIVPYQDSFKLAEKIATSDVNVLIRKNAEHRFCQPEDIQLLFEVLNCHVHGTDKVRDLAIRAWSPFTVYSRAHMTKNPQTTLSENEG